MSENKKQSISNKEVLDVKEDINVLENQAQKLAELIDYDVKFKEWDDVNERINNSVNKISDESIIRVEEKQQIELEKVKNEEKIKLEELSLKEAKIRKEKIDILEKEKQLKEKWEKIENDSNIYSNNVKEISKINVDKKEVIKESDLISLDSKEKINFFSDINDFSTNKDVIKKETISGVKLADKKNEDPKVEIESENKTDNKEVISGAKLADKKNEDPKVEIESENKTDNKEVISVAKLADKKNEDPKVEIESKNKTDNKEVISGAKLADKKNEDPKVEIEAKNNILNEDNKRNIKSFSSKKDSKKKKTFNKNSKNQKQSFTGYNEKVVRVKRISKTTKGGRNMRFSALVIIGDKNGMVGYGIGKSIEVPVAIRKALKDAKNNMVKVKINKNGSLFHEVLGRKGAGKVLLKPAPEGTGIIAGGPIRVVLEMAGYKDAYSKNLGKNTSLNMVLATINGLLIQKTPKEIAELRDKDIKNL